LAFGITQFVTICPVGGCGVELNPAPHVPDDIVDSVLQQFQPALEC
jgi:hypothetical protein